MGCLVGRPPFSDLFGKRGRRWLAELTLPGEERESVDSALRQIEFLDSEIEAVERLIAAAALEWPEIKRLMTVPGVNVIVAATFMAAIGDIRRFESPRKLVGYLGLDPRVKQSGAAPATHGRISKQGSSPARHALVEASWSVVRQPGPIHAFYQRIRVRRGHQVAIVAAARKLACLFWCLLIRGEDYAYGQPSLTQKKLRLLEIRAGAQDAQGHPDRNLGNEAEDARGRARAGGPGRGRLPAHGRRLATNRGEKKGRRRDTGARISWAVKRPSSAAGPSPRACSLARRQNRRPNRTLPNWRCCVQKGLDFHASSKALLRQPGARREQTPAVPLCLRRTQARGALAAPGEIDEHASPVSGDASARLPALRSPHPERVTTQCPRASEKRGGWDPVAEIVGGGRNRAEEEEEAGGPK